MSTSARPLSDVKVLEFTHAIMGPACGLVLADLGAQVVKIEPVDGDHTRRLLGFGTGYFTFFNRNKKSLAVNIKTDAGREIIYKLVTDADVLIENFAPGTMDRLGFGYEALSAINPRLIYCSLKGFQKGPYEQRTALDEVVQMMSGLAYMTGPTGQPLRAGASIVDIMGGSYGALGVLAALREREATGKGQFVMNGLFETAAFIMGQHMAYAAISKVPVPPMPERIAAWGIYHKFATADGTQVFVGVTSDKQWPLFCEAFGRDDLLADQRLATNSDRVRARDWLLPELADMIGQMPEADVIRACESAGIPFAPIARPEDLFEDPQLNEGGSLLETTLPDGSTAKFPKLPLLVGDHDLGLYLEPPQIGEHSAQILRDAGYTSEQISSLAAEGVITTDG